MANGIYIILYDILLINNVLEQMGSDLPQLNRHGICDVSTLQVGTPVASVLGSEGLVPKGPGLETIGEFGEC